MKIDNKDTESEFSISIRLAEWHLLDILWKVNYIWNEIF